MDSLTHVVIGGCIGEAFLGKKIGKRGMLIGAVAQSIPDIDFIASFWLDTAEDLLAHRGFTHSILFAVIVAPLLGLLSERWHRPHNIPLKTWILFFGLQILLHDFIDGFNVYGTGWLEPFSHQRFSFNTIFVADPMFSIWPAISFAALLLLGRYHRRRTLLWVTGLIASGAYLLFTASNKILIDRTTKAVLKNEHIGYSDYMSTPTPLNSLLWYIIAKDEEGYHIGYRSIFDTAATIDFHYFPKNDSLLKGVADNESLQHLRRFSQGFYTLQKWNDTLVFNDLRFGQMIGWVDPEEHFVFYYYLEQPDNNDIIIQRGRFAKWNKNVASTLLKRMIGH